jgi:hypothetical protein
MCIHNISKKNIIYNVELRYKPFEACKLHSLVLQEVNTHPRRSIKCLKDCFGIPKEEGGYDYGILCEDTSLGSALTL